MPNPVALIVAAGPGLGAAVARRLGRDGYDVALLARTEVSVAALGETLRGEGITTTWAAVDAGDADALGAAVDRVGAAGGLRVVHFNAVAGRTAPPAELTAADLLADLAVGTAALLTTVRAARPHLAAGSVVMATGGGTADRPWAPMASLGVQKAALRNLVTVLDGDLRPAGVRAASLTVTGIIRPDSPFAPERIAERFAALAAAADAGDDWRTEVVFDGT